MRNRHANSLLGIFTGLMLVSCSAPRAITHSGMVTPKGQFKGGGDMVLSVSAETVSRLADISEDVVKFISEQDSVFLSEQTNAIAAALVSYALDPSGAGYDLYARYGLATRADVGYKYAFGAHAFDAMYQFLGPAGTGQQAASGQWYGSAGLQYSWQKSDLPDKLFLDKLGPVLDFSALRRDVLLPVVFSYSFGPGEQYGHIGFGAVLQRSFIRYTFEPGRLFEKLPGAASQVPVKVISERQSYGSVGVFANAKLGYKNVYVLPALAVYYQNYGTYTLPGGSTVALKGLSFIPSLGVQLWFGKGE